MIEQLKRIDSYSRCYSRLPYSVHKKSLATPNRNPKGLIIVKHKAIKIKRYLQGEFKTYILKRSYAVNNTFLL